MKSNLSYNPDMIMLRRHLNDIRRDISNMLNHFGCDAVKNVEDFGDDIKSGSNKTLNDISCEYDHAVKLAGKEIKTHPIITASIALMATYAVYRLMQK